METKKVITDLIAGRIVAATIAMGALSATASVRDLYVAVTDQVRAAGMISSADPALCAGRCGAADVRGAALRHAKSQPGFGVGRASHPGFFVLGLGGGGMTIAWE